MKSYIIVFTQNRRSVRLHTVHNMPSPRAAITFCVDMYKDSADDYDAVYAMERF